MLHRALITNNLLGYDIHLEYYIAKLTMTQGCWDPFFPTAVNSCISLTILPPILAYCTKIELAWVLKLIYPFIFANVPVVIFKLYKKRLGVKGAALASFLFIVQFVFFSEMLGLARQQVAELMAMLSLYYATDQYDRLTNRILGVLFLFATALSHYGLTLILLLIVSLAVLFFREVRRYKVFLLILLVFTLAWQSYTAGGTVVDSVAGLLKRSYTSAYYDFFGGGAREDSIYLALGSGAEQLSLPRKAYWLLQQTVQGVIVLGFLSRVVYFYRTKARVPVEEALAMTGLTTLLFCIAVPYFADGLNVTRIYHISLLFVGYYFAVGSAFLHKIAGAYLRVDKFLPARMILMFYFFFSSGYAYVVLGDRPSSIALNYQEYEDAYYYDNETAAVAWASQRQIREITGFTKYSRLLLGEFYGLEVNEEIRGTTCLFVREHGDRAGIEQRTEQRPVIYDSGAKIYGRKAEEADEETQSFDSG